MRSGRIGGALLMAGCAVFAVTGALSRSGANSDSQLDIGRLVLNASLALIGSGAAVLGVAGPRPLHGSAVRAGLGLLVVGALGVAVALNAPIPAGTNNLQSAPFVFGGIVGLGATVLGLLAIGLSLVRVPGPSRVAGALLLAGLALVPLSAGSSGVLLGGMALGLLAINGDRSVGTPA